MSLDEWLSRFVPICAIALDEALEFQKQVAHKVYGFDLPAFNKSWEEGKKQFTETVIRKALDELIAIRPQLKYRLVNEDPMELAVKLAPGIAKKILEAESRR